MLTQIFKKLIFERDKTNNDTSKYCYETFYQLLSLNRVLILITLSGVIVLKKKEGIRYRQSVQTSTTCPITLKKVEQITSLWILFEQHVHSFKSVFYYLNYLLNSNSNVCNFLFLTSSNLQYQNVDNGKSNYLHYYFNYEQHIAESLVNKL